MKKIIKKKPTSVSVKSQSTKMVRPMHQQAGSMNQMQPTQPSMKKGGKIKSKRKKCCGGGRI